MIHKALLFGNWRSVKILSYAPNKDGQGQGLRMLFFLENGIQQKNMT